MRILKGNLIDNRGKAVWERKEKAWVTFEYYVRIEDPERNIKVTYSYTQSVDDERPEVYDVTNNNPLKDEREIAWEELPKEIQDWYLESHHIK